MTIGGETMETPGFLRCEVTSTIHERTYKGMATVAFAPEKIAPTQVNPADFDTFWEAQLALLKDVPLGLKKTLLPDLCTPAVNVYAVRYMSRNHWREVPFYGILTEPVKPGTYPAVLRVPGPGYALTGARSGYPSKESSPLRSASTASRSPTMTAVSTTT
jgi:cephalosporin-C deacetylase